MNGDAATIEGVEGRAVSVPLWSLVIPVIAALLLVLTASQRGDGRLHIRVLDVGEGDAILIRTPHGHTALVDGGPGATPLTEGIGAHTSFWLRSLDLVVLTQPQQDNMMGLVDLLGRYKVGQVVQTEFTPTTSLQQAWAGALSQHDVPVRSVRRGDIIGFDDETDLLLMLLNPPEGLPLPVKGSKSAQQNNASIVLRVDYGSSHVLLASDIEKEAEAGMLRHAQGSLQGGELRSQVLKVASHGSATTSSQGFIEAVRPVVSIISVGAANKSGHPAADTLDRLRQAGSQIYRTDQNGTVELIMEKDKFWVRSEK